MLSPLRSISLVAAVFAWICCDAQVVIFQTVEDVLAEDGQVYNEGQLVKTKGNCARKVIIDKGKSTMMELTMDNCFAFVIKDTFYRWHEQSGIPVCLVRAGSIFSWQNGPAQLWMQQKNVTSAEVSCGALAYLSETVDGKLIPVPSNSSGAVVQGQGERDLQDWFAARPQYKPILDCLTHDRHYITVRHCVKLFNEGEIGIED